MQNGMMGAGGQLHHGNSHLGHQGLHHPLDHGLPQPPQPSGGGASSHSPASTASTTSSQATPTSVPPTTSSAPPCTSSPSSSASSASAGQHKRCGRPGCSNPVQGWANSEFCSNECVVGQCREVYTHWSSSGSGTTTQPQAQQQQYSATNGSATNRTTTPVK